MNNGDKASYRSGGVGAGSGVGKDSGLSREISRREAATLQPTVQAGQTSKPGGARGEVGDARSSVDPVRREHSGELFARRGEMTPPWGVPCLLGKVRRVPRVRSSSTMGAWSHARMRASTVPSLILRATNSMSLS